MNWVGMRFLNEQILCPFFVSIILIYKSEILGLCLIQFSVFCTFVNVKAVQCCVSQEVRAASLFGQKHGLLPGP